MSLHQEHFNIHEIYSGTLINNRYEVVRRLGSGATGTVFECIDRVLGNLKVALKIISTNGPQGARAIARLDREIRACFRIKSPYVVQFYDLIEIGDTLGYTMEYVEGGSIECLRSRNEKLPLAWRVGLFQYICQGMQAIHEAGVIHRDIKPANILLNNQGFPKITDFGLARLAEADPDAPLSPGGQALATTSRISHEKGLLGTPEFMAPESVEHNIFNHQTDLYALGVTGFELLTGKQVYAFSNIAELLTLKLNQDAPLVHEITPEIPESISMVIKFMTERDPGARYNNAAEVVDNLQSAMHHAKLSPLMSFPTRTPERRQEELARDTGSAFDFSFGWRPAFQDAASELKDFVNSGPIVLSRAQSKPAQRRSRLDLNICIIVMAWVAFGALLWVGLSGRSKGASDEYKDPQVRERPLLSKIFDPFQPQRKEKRRR